MSEENVEAIKQMFEAFNRDPRSGLDWIDPEVEWDMTAVGIPGLSGVYCGLDELQRFWVEWFTAIEGYRIEPLEFIDAGNAVVVVMDTWGRGRESGIDIDRRWFDVYRLRDGKVLHYRACRDMAEALEAAGLSK